MCLLIYALVLLFPRLGFPLLLGCNFDVEEKLLGREGGKESRGGHGLPSSVAGGKTSEAVTDTAHLPKEGVPQPRESCKVIESSTVISVIPGKDFKADMTVLRQQG